MGKYEVLRKNTDDFQSLIIKELEQLNKHLIEKKKKPHDSELEK